MKRVLLGLGNESFNKIIRQALEPQFHVIKEEVLSHKYLEELIYEQNPDIIIVHDTFLASEKTDQYEKEVEWLQTIENIRRAYDDSKRIVFVCERKQGDPFLSELVNRNVLDIFHNRNLDIQTMINQLLDQPRYSKVAYLKVEGSGKRYNQSVYEQYPDQEIEGVEDKKTKGKGFLKISLPKISLPTITIKKKKKRKEEQQPESEITTEMDLEQAESIEQTEPVEPVETVEPIDLEPSEIMESTEPIESIKQTEAVERVESIDLEPSEIIESTEPIESIEQTETVERVESIELKEPVESVESVETVESIDLEPSEKIEPTEPIEPTDSAEQEEPIESIENEEFSEEDEDHKKDRNVKGKKKTINFLFENLFSGSIEKEKELISTIRPRLIAVGSITPGAGSTFFLHNFSRYLSDKGISCGILEALNDMDALLALSLSESPPEFDWECVHNLVQKGTNHLYSIKKWTIDRTMVIPTHNVEKKTFTKEHAKEVIYYARQNPLVFVDISHDWSDPISIEALGLCDELWCITEPNPMYLEVQRKHHQHIYQVSNRVGEENVIVIGNKWGDGVDLERFPELFITLPYIPENPRALSDNKPVYELKPKSFAAFSKLYTRLNQSIV